MLHALLTTLKTNGLVPQVFPDPRARALVALLLAWSKIDLQPKAQLGRSSKIVLINRS